ncbi:RNA-directed DNA polymerase, eukaryota [Tanacetum coccineum]
MSPSKEEDKESRCSGHFRRVEDPQTGGGILCVWDPRMFRKHNSTVLVYFVAIQGGLVEVPLGGCAFTWCHKSGNKMSKLDRFLISEGLMGLCPNIFAITLDCYLSDHTWSNSTISDNNAIAKFIKKLKYLKEQIRLWVLLNKRSQVMNSLHELEKSESMEIAQKAKIKWSIERDGNSKYFYGILNKKRYQLTIRGILAEGVWIDAPNSVKNEFLSHFKEHFDRPCSSRLMLDMTYPNRLNSDQIDDLERNVTKEEIKRVVWDCGTDKSPAPDGTFPKGGNAYFIALIPKMQDAKVVKDYRPISLIGSMYKIIAKILVNRLVVVLGDLVNEVQSAFIANRQILDSPFILNEFIHWCKSKKKQTMIFKIDFEKAYDSVRCDYLDDVLNKFGFASVLRMNLHKSKLIGIVVEDEKVSRSAMKMRCCTLKTPFSYLGIKVGGTMSRIKSWDKIVAKLHSRLSKWKMKTLSIRGRLTLLKSVLGSTHIYYMSMFKVPSQVLKCLEDIRRQFFNGADPKEKKMSWVKWSRVLASKDKGGFPRVYALESDKKITVAAKINHNDLGYSLCRKPRDGAA